MSLLSRNTRKQGIWNLSRRAPLASTNRAKREGDGARVPHRGLQSAALREIAQTPEGVLRGFVLLGDEMGGEKERKKREMRGDQIYFTASTTARIAASVTGMSNWTEYDAPSTVQIAPENVSFSPRMVTFTPL